jgi:hypothetical protein
MNSLPRLKAVVDSFLKGERFGGMPDFEPLYDRIRTVPHLAAGSFGAFTRFLD